MAYVKLRPRRGTAEEWNKYNIILSEGEFGVEVPADGVGTGISNIKIGDGVTPWNDLPYAILGSGGDGEDEGPDYSEIINMLKLELGDVVIEVPQDEWFLSGSVYMNTVNIDNLRDDYPITATLYNEAICSKNQIYIFDNVLEEVIVDGTSVTFIASSIPNDSISIVLHNALKSSGVGEGTEFEDIIDDLRDDLDGTIVQIPTSGWVDNGGSFTNTINATGVDDTKSIDIFLYNEILATEEELNVFEEIITDFTISNEKLIVTAKSIPTVPISVLVKSIMLVESDGRIANLENRLSALNAELIATGGSGDMNLADKVEAIYNSITINPPKIIYLGRGSQDVSKYAGYKTFTIGNFLIGDMELEISSQAVSGNGENTVTSDTTKTTCRQGASYDASTGKLTIVTNGDTATSSKTDSTYNLSAASTSKLAYTELPKVWLVLNISST